MSFEVNPLQFSPTGKVSTFWVKAPRELSLVWYRNRQVEVSGRLVPDGRFHTPTIIVDSIRVIRGALNI